MSPLRRSIRWIRARPVRPLPSAKGWIASNWACTTAACTSGPDTGELMHSNRSSIRAGTASGGGGTCCALRGVDVKPEPIQFWPERICPAMGSSSPLSVRCMEKMSSTVTGPGDEPISRACSVASMLRRASKSCERGCSCHRDSCASALASRRAEGRTPSMVLDAALSARRSSHSAGAAEPCGWSASNARTAFCAASTRRHVSSSNVGAHPETAWGTKARNTSRCGSPSATGRETCLRSSQNLSARDPTSPPSPVTNPSG